MDEQLLDTWAIHNRIILYLLDALEPEGLRSVPAGGKGRSVAQMLAHLHNIRLTWLEVSAPDLMNGLDRLETRSKAAKEALTQEALRRAIEASGRAFEALFRQGLEKGKIKNPKPHLMGFFGYVIAHEWYHVGEVCMALE